jgi:two-component system, cell cycle response regulator DivK
MGLVSRASPVQTVVRNCTVIKALTGFTAIPIIAVSSFAMKGDEEKARAAGCDHYVTKPYSPVQLLRIIRGLLCEEL